MVLHEKIEKTITEWYSTPRLKLPLHIYLSPFENYKYLVSSSKSLFKVHI